MSLAPAKRSQALAEDRAARKIINEESMLVAG
jgi:hypothetical protein